MFTSLDLSDAEKDFIQHILTKYTDSYREIDFADHLETRVIVTD